MERNLIYIFENKAVPRLTFERKLKECKENRIDHVVKRDGRKRELMVIDNHQKESQDIKDWSWK